MDEFPRPSINTLPLETVQLTSEYLDGPRSDICHFTTLNKRCRAGGMPVLHRRVHLKVLNASQLASDTRRWSSLLERNASWRSVYELKLDGCMSKSDNIEEAMARANEIDLLDIFRPDFESAQATYDTDHLWLPLARLMEQLPALRSIIYNCANQFPPCLLAALPPTCRLRIDTFRFRSLSNASMDSHEFSLATSPNLYSVGMHYMQRHDDGDEDYNFDAMTRMVTGLTPNLEEVNMLPIFVGWSPGLVHAMGKPRIPWRGSASGSSSSTQSPAHRKGSLRRLGLESGVSREVLEHWFSHTDINVLSHLHLGFNLDYEALVWTTNNVKLQALRSLTIDLSDDSLSTQDFDSFFRSLPPLHTLHISAATAAFDIRDVVEQCGESLRVLRLPSKTSINRPISYGEDLDHVRLSAPR